MRSYALRTLLECRRTIRFIGGRDLPCSKYQIHLASPMIGPVMAKTMTELELQEVVDALLGKVSSRRGNHRSLIQSINRKKFPGAYFSILEPLLYNEYAYKHAMDVIANLRDPPAATSDAIEQAWDRSWSQGVPQSCESAFPALLKIGGNDSRLLAMIEKAMQSDNYAVHKVCAENLMKIDGGRQILAEWDKTIRGQCDCHLHRKLAAKIAQFVLGDTD
jgi:hypothetical protein